MDWDGNGFNEIVRNVKGFNGFVWNGKGFNGMVWKGYCSLLRATIYDRKKSTVVFYEMDTEYLIFVARLQKRSLQHHSRYVTVF